MPNILKSIGGLFVKLILVMPLGAQTKDNHTSAAVNKKTVSSAKVKAFQILSLSPPLPKDYYVKKLPFFCRKELQIERSTKIHIRFRVGSVEYCNKLEGKHF